MVGREIVFLVLCLVSVLLEILGKGCLSWRLCSCQMRSSDQSEGSSLVTLLEWSVCVHVCLFRVKKNE